MYKYPSQQDLAHYLSLIQLERQEEINQYRQSIATLSIHERRKKGTTWYPITISNEEIGLGEKIMLDLQRPTTHTETHQFQQGQTCAIFVNAKVDGEENPALNGVIAWVRDNTMRVVIHIDNLPDWLYEGKLGVDMLYNETTFKEMEAALQRTIKAESSRLKDLREILLGYRPAESTRIEKIPHYSNLNPSQNFALQKVATATDLAIIHGPPGTGKTTTLVQTIAYTLQSERQVLVCAASNAAVDLLTEKLTALNLQVVRLGHPARINETLLEHTLEGQMAMHQDYKRLQQFRKEAHNYRKEARKFRRTFGPEQREERKQLLEQARLLIDHAKMTERYIVESIIDNAQVIACTLTGAANSEIQRLRFKTVFIDEGSQALLPATFIPITKAERVVLAGDHQQLPPTVKSMDAQQQGLSKSLFEWCIEKQSNAATMLQTQYRMNEQIMGFSSVMFYQNRLIADETVRSHILSSQPNEPLLNAPFDYIDTAGCGFEETFNGISLSTSNDNEAKLLLDYVERIYTRLEAVCTHQVWEFTVGIISPYKEQVLLLRQMMKNYELLMRYGTQISINTVDGFQGQERDIIAISLVRSNDRNEIGFLKDLRRMNVALTRARKKLIVVGDSATLGSHQFYATWIKYTEDIEAYHSAWEFLYEE